MLFCEVALVKMTATVTEKQRSKAEAIFSLFNLGCSSCSSLVERKLKKLPGIKNVTVSNLTDTVLVDYDPEQLNTEEIRLFIRKLGYETGVKQ
jgi:copper chaperone CopZ